MLCSRRSQPRFSGVAWCESVRSLRSFSLGLSCYHMREVSTAGAAGSVTLSPDIQTPLPRRSNAWPDMRPPSSSGAPNHVGTVAAAAASAYEDGQKSRRQGPYSYSGSRPWYQRWNQTVCSNSWRRTPDKDRPLKPQRRIDDHRYWLHASEPASFRGMMTVVGIDGHAW